MGFAAEREAEKIKPAVNRLFKITNHNDESVNNDINTQFVELWQKHEEAFVCGYMFKKEQGLSHDSITPTIADGDTATTYPIIIDAITNQVE